MVLSRRHQRLELFSVIGLLLLLSSHFENLSLRFVNVLAFNSLFGRLLVRGLNVFLILLVLLLLKFSHALHWRLW